MTTAHPEEETLQQYAINPIDCTAAIQQHIITCTNCQAAVALYTAVFAGIQHEPAAAFDINLEQLVMAQLPAPGRRWPWTMLIIGVALAAVTITAAWWFRGALLSLFNGLMPATIYMVLVVPVAIAVFQAVELFQRYQKLISAVKE